MLYVFTLGNSSMALLGGLTVPSGLWSPLVAYSRSLL